MNSDLIVVRQLPIIEDQLRQVKATVEARVGEALSLACTEETRQAVKEARSALNKEFGELEARRKEVKASIMAPYEAFEALYKECAADIYRDALPVIGYMAFFEYLNGFRKVLYWSKQKMIRHADTYSPAYSAEAHKKLLSGEIPEKDMWKYSSFWYKNFDDMAKKTMLRQLISRWGVMSTELQRAFVQDTNFAAIGDGNEIVTTPEEQLQITQPEATDVVEKIDLSDI